MLYQLHSCPLNILRRIHNNTEIISLIYSSLHISKEFNLRLPLISSRLWQCYLINIAIYLKIRISNLVPARSIIKLIRNCSTIPEISRTIRSPDYLCSGSSGSSAGSTVPSSQLCSFTTIFLIVISVSVSLPPKSNTSFTLSISSPGMSDR